MKQAAYGDRVAVRYIGTLDNGRIFASTEDEGGPLNLTLGKREIFPALEERIVGMTEGEARNIVLSPEEAYGPRRQENILTLSREMFPEDREIRVGQKLNLEFKDGSSRLMRVIRSEGGEVTLDGNHALAGLELTFALKLEAIG